MYKIPIAVIPESLTDVRYNAKKGDNLFAKVRDIFSSRKDSRAGCNQYAMLTQFAMCLSV